MSKKKFKVGGLFSGVGGIELGFKSSGFEIAWANEIDRYCAKTYKKNSKLMPRSGFERPRGACASGFEWLRPRGFETSGSESCATQRKLAQTRRNSHSAKSQSLLKCL